MDVTSISYPPTSGQLDQKSRLKNEVTNEGVIPAGKRLDSLHISVATVNDLEFIFSFNFQHINRIKTKMMTSLINAREGYKPITITVPSEVIEYGKSE